MNKIIITILTIITIMLIACTPQETITTENIAIENTTIVNTIGYYNNTNQTIEPGQPIYLNLSEENNLIYIKENDTFVKTNITLEE